MKGQDLHLTLEVNMTHIATYRIEVIVTVGAISTSSN